MRPILGLALALMIAGSASTVYAGRQATVYLTDGTKLEGTVEDENFGIRTDYGTLDVPIDRIDAMFPGFRAGTTTAKRIDDYIARLATSDAAAISALKRMGRLTIPQLQDAAGSKDKAIAKNAQDLLKELWPTGERVPNDGAAILRAEGMEFRGTLSFQWLSMSGGFGKKKINKTGIRLVQFAEGDPAVASNPPAYGPNKGEKAPEFELVMADGSRILGTIDDYSVDVETDFGKLRVPVKDVIVVKLGDPDAFVTRQISFVGKLSTATIELDTKIGGVKVDRDKVVDLAAVLDKTGAAVVAADEGVKPNMWVQIFDGKAAKDWNKWGAGESKLEDASLHLKGDAGMTYTGMPDSDSLILAALLKFNGTTGQGGGVKIGICDSETGSYFIHFTGDGGQLYKWDNKTKQSVTLKAFQSPPAADGIYTLQLYRGGTKVLAYVNGQEAANVDVPKPHILPPGKVFIGVWNADAAFKDVRVKVMK